MTQPTVTKTQAQMPMMPISWPEDAEIKVYTGGCHCRKVRYEFEHPDIYAMPVMNCNCSICVDRGYLCVYTPSDQFRFTAGKDELTQYEFGNHVVIHRFCSKCGTSIGPFEAPGAVFEGVVVVNARTIDGVELDRLELQKYNGRSR